MAPNYFNETPDSVVGYTTSITAEQDAHKRTILVLSSVLGPVAFLSILSRLWIRFRIERSTDIDDWLMIASLIPLIGLFITVGLGKFRVPVRPLEIRNPNTRARCSLLQ